MAEAPRCGGGGREALRVLRLTLLGASLVSSAAGPAAAPAAGAAAAGLPCPPPRPAGNSSAAGAEGRELARVVVEVRGAGSGRGADAAAEDCPVTVADWGRPAGIIHFDYARRAGE